MRVNVYAEEMTDHVEIVEKNGFTGLRIYLELPASFVPDPGADGALRPAHIIDKEQAQHFQAPFIHHPGDDDSSAVTFWGKRSLRDVVRQMDAKLSAHYGDESFESQIGRLGAAIIALGIDEPSKDEAAVDTAIRLLQRVYGKDAPKIRFVFEGENPNMVFVEAHDEEGKSVEVGNWVADGDYQAVDISPMDILKANGQ